MFIEQDLHKLQAINTISLNGNRTESKFHILKKFLKTVGHLDSSVSIIHIHY